ncbi:MFS general substrate transporter [Cadophora sp. DSE1049]|nr:MFS general substrate transporter [Cadophora sp. DSE1049]
MSSEYSTSGITNAVDHVEHVETVLSSEKEVRASTATSKKALHDGEKTPSHPGAAGENPEETPYPKTMQMILLTIGICLIMFMITLDMTIIATAIPRITTQFNSINDVGWYGSAYLLTMTSLQPSFGKIYTFFNIKMVFLSSIVIFEVGSILCAAAPSSVVLIVGRAVAGIGSAGLMTGSMVVLGNTVPLRKRAMYIGAVTSMYGISSVLGPILGGINLPFGGLALLFVSIVFHNPKRKTNKLSFTNKIRETDPIGATFLIGGVICLLLALQWGGISKSWSSPEVYGCLIGFGLMITIFIFLQALHPNVATIPPRLFLKQRTVFLSAWIEHVYYLAFYFQVVKGTTAEGSGIRSIPYLISITLAAMTSGLLVSLLGFYAPFIWAGTAIFTIGCGMLYTLDVCSTLGKWFGYEVIAGIGVGACFQIPIIAVQVVLSTEDMPTGNAICFFFNSLGGAIAISIAQNIFSNTLNQQLPIQAPLVNPLLVMGAGATGLRAAVPYDLLPGVLKAYAIAIQKAFILPIVTAGVAFLCGVGIERKTVKGKKLAVRGV